LFHPPLPNGDTEGDLEPFLPCEIIHNGEKPMTHHMSCEVAVLAGIVSLYLSVLALPINRGLAGQRTEMPVLSFSLSIHIDRLKNEDNSVRQAAAGALRWIGPEAIPALTQALQQDTGAGVRGAAAWALGEIGLEAKSAIPALTKALEDDGIRKAAAGSHAKIALALQDAQATEMIGPLKTILDVLSAYPDTRDSAAAKTVRRAINALESLQWSRLQARLWQWVAHYPFPTAILVAYPSLLLCWLACYWLRPQWLYRINESLKPYTDFALPTSLGG
jgi:HEAT repeats